MSRLLLRLLFHTQIKTANRKLVSTATARELFIEKVLKEKTVQLKASEGTGRSIDIETELVYP